MRLMRKSADAFTTLEMLIAMTVLTLLVIFVARLVDTAATITGRGVRRMDSSAQVRPLFDRMTVDFSQMVKRSDIDFYGKGTSAGGAMTGGNDRIAFYSMVPGDYSSTGSQSPFSLIAYKINSSTAAANASVYTRLQRMARGLLMNGDSSANNGPSPTITEGPIVFAPITIAFVWPTVTSNATTDSKYELAGPAIFRFEYYYLLSNGHFSVVPWDASASGHTDAAGMRDVAAIVVAVASIDSKSRRLLDNSKLATIAGTLVDYSAGAVPVPGWLVTQWQTAIDTPTNASVKLMPRPALSAIRFFERYFYLVPTAQ